MSLLLLLTLHPSPNVGRVPYAIYPAVPLAVRSPYLNCWLHNNDVSKSGQTWPTTFNSSQILGWSVLIRVDNLTYSFLGDVPRNLVNDIIYLNSTLFSIGPTYAQLGGQAGPMHIDLKFLNPIEPGDWVKQSIPFSYMSLTASSSDGASHHLQVYSDVSGEWISGDRTQQILWSPTINDDVVFHSVRLQTPENFTEKLDQAEWGILYYAMKNEVNVTYQAASDVDSRSNFTSNGKLTNQQHSNLTFTSNSSAVFAISRDLGTIRTTPVDPVVWAIGYTTDNAINYADLHGAIPTSRYPYYKTKYSDDADLITDFLNDFGSASSRADHFNNKTYNASDSIISNLGQMVFIAIAEVYGGMQLTIGTDLNESDVMMFMKNIGGVKKNRVNAVETLYAASPALVYIDPSLGIPLLEPLFRLQASRNYTVGYAAADLGSDYPTVSGSNLNHSQGVEQTGNMLIMTYAYARASGNGSLIGRYYPLLTSWADYLNASTLFITNQSSADNLTVNNQTNLAIKGIIAIKAMSEMSWVANHTEDANKYSSAAARLYAQWKSIALGSDQHLLAVYGAKDSESWTLGYNLFADVWLSTDLVEQSVYTNHSNYIDSLQNSSFSFFGMPVDNTNPSVAVSSWSLFVAAMTKNQGLRNTLIAKVSDRSADTTFPASVFSVYYDSTNGTSLQGVASPAQGAVLAPLALSVPNRTIIINGTLANLPNKNVGAYIGGTIGGLVAILAVIVVITFVRRRRRRRRSGPRSVLSTDSVDTAPQMVVSPFVWTPFNTNQNSGISMEQPLVFEEPEAEMIPLVPVGLPDKELARIRAEALNSPQPQNFQASTSNMPQSTSPQNAVTGSEESPIDTRRLHSEFQSLRREVERLREEGLPMILSAPPSYAEGEE